MEVLVNKKSKAIANKALKRANKELNGIIRKSEIFNKVRELDEAKTDNYIGNLCITKYENLIYRIDKAGSDLNFDTNFLKGAILNTLFLDRDFMKDMIKNCK